MKEHWKDAEFWLLRLGEETTDRRVVEEIGLPMLGVAVMVMPAGTVVGTITGWTVDSDGWLRGSGMVDPEFAELAPEVGLGTIGYRMDDMVCIIQGGIRYVALGTRPCWDGCRIEVKP